MTAALQIISTPLLSLYVYQCIVMLGVRVGLLLTTRQSAHWLIFWPGPAGTIHPWSALLYLDLQVGQTDDRRHVCCDRKTPHQISVRDFSPALWSPDLDTIIPSALSGSVEWPIELLLQIRYKMKMWSQWGTDWWDLPELLLATNKTRKSVALLQIIYLMAMLVRGGV